MSDTFEPEYTEKVVANAGSSNRMPFHLNLRPFFVDADSWVWHFRNGWELASEPWQKFNEQWYGATAIKQCVASLHDHSCPLSPWSHASASFRHQSSFANVTW